MNVSVVTRKIWIVADAHILAANAMATVVIVFIIIGSIANYPVVYFLRLLKRPMIGLWNISYKYGVAN